jgi:hypothetical protein
LDAAPPDRPATAANDDDASGNTVPPEAGSADVVHTIAAHPQLPADLRSALAELVARRGQLVQGAVQLPVADLLPVLAQALPPFLRRDAAGLTTAEHPAGDAFFEGLAGELSEAAAERLARAQLAASGLLRGQTARGGA